MVDWIQRGLESDCPWCDGRGTRAGRTYELRECPICHGSGFYELAGAAKHQCDLCKGTGRRGKLNEQDEPCTCDGGRLKYGRYTLEVQHPVLTAVLTTMGHMREQSDFDRMNSALDWGLKYVAEGLAAAMNENPEVINEVARRVKQAGEMQAQARGIQFVASPIPPDELAKLLADYDRETKS